MLASQWLTALNHGKERVRIGQSNYGFVCLLILLYVFFQGCCNFRFFCKYLLLFMYFCIIKLSCKSIAFLSFCLFTYTVSPSRHEKYVFRLNLIQINISLSKFWEHNSIYVFLKYQHLYFMLSHCVCMLLKVIHCCTRIAFDFCP